jgi:hypothetical protein
MPVDINNVPKETGDELYAANGVRVVITSEHFVFEVSEDDFIGGKSWVAKTALALNMNADDANQPIMDRVMFKLATSLLPNT